MKEKIFVLDNYDSFTYNIITYIRLLYAHIVIVCRNSYRYIGLEEIDAYNKILLSPGPGLSDKANIFKPLIKYYAAVKKILGVCLGNQAIAEVFGGKLINPENHFHGLSCKITIVDGEEKIFDNLPTFMFGGMYNSWIVSECYFPNELKITARGSKGEIIALRHKYYDVIGVQFHPESILTYYGINIIYNWLISPK